LVIGLSTRLLGLRAMAYVTVRRIWATRLVRRRRAWPLVYSYKLGQLAVTGGWGHGRRISAIIPVGGASNCQSVSHNVHHHQPVACVVAEQLGVVYASK